MVKDMYVQHDEPMSNIVYCAVLCCFIDINVIELQLTVKAESSCFLSKYYNFRCDVNQ